MITNFENRLSGSSDMTISGKRSLENRKIILYPKRNGGEVPPASSFFANNFVSNNGTQSKLGEFF